MGLGAAIVFDGEVANDLQGAESVEVYECMGETTTYRIRYKTVDISKGDLLLLRDDRLSVGSELSILVEVNRKRSCLVKGPVYAQRIRLVHGGAGSSMDVLGADTSITLDREDRAKVWPDGDDKSIVTAMLQPHFDMYEVDSTAATYAEAKHLLVQRETDLALIRRLARRNGCLFWITCDDKGKQTAHFKRPPVSGAEVVELVINTKADPAARERPPSMTTLDIDWDAEQPVSAVALQLDLNTKQPIDGSVTSSPLTALGARSLAAIAPGVQALHLAAAADTAGDLQARAEAALIEAGFFVRATGTTTAKALGKVLRAHTVVKLSGAGTRHSGKYFCARVRHTINADSHEMEFELRRNAWGA